MGNKKSKGCQIEMGGGGEFSIRDLFVILLHRLFVHYSAIVEKNRNIGIIISVK